MDTDLTPQVTPRRFGPSGPVQWLAVVVAGLVFAAWAGYLVGNRPDPRPARDSVDVGFLYDMLAHHEQALELSSLVIAHGSDESQAKRFALEIVGFQSYEIGKMEAALTVWRYPRDNPPKRSMAWMGTPVATEAMPGMASDEELRLLAASRGRDADALFLALMRDHHAGAVHMGEYAAERAQDRAIRAFARLVVRNQQIEINELRLAAQDAGLPESPPGFVPDKMPAGSAHSDHAGH